MFIINLSVGVIVDKFMSMKQSNTAVMLTEPQKNWVNSITSLYSRRQIVALMDLHEKPYLRRKVYDLVSSEIFETIIMGAIVVNTLFLAAKITPTPFPEWETFLETVNYIFAAIFTVECVLKLFALRSNYWGDRWNCFDFMCVVATIVGIVVSRASNVRIDPIIQVIRIFRIARLFRLLRFLKGLNKIFMALLMSLPKLMNVLLILLLLLILYSILGVSLFATTKLGGTLDIHANFQNFILAFITLFRASTGEAWNEIMHDIARSPREIFNSGEWCSPDYLFDTYRHYEVLSEKCLIQRPNSCVGSTLNGKFVPFAYWVTYTLFVSIMVMNLVIAVILESYEEGKGERESEIIEYCLKLWRERDPDLKLRLPMAEAVVFVTDAVKYGIDLHAVEDTHSRKAASVPKFGSARLAEVPMKFLSPMDLPVDPAGEVSFMSALLQVLKLLCHKWDPTLIDEILGIEEGLSPELAEKLKMDKILPIKQRILEEDRNAYVKDHVAALKIQRILRDRRAARAVGVKRAGQRHSFQDRVS
mmetsp:Transcript_31128/g.71864  ORF Transcript_31128/g.71864 Transcript_31128/m.71864 type:complete len:532 (+) Transcript_31128:2-1597(+)